MPFKAQPDDNLEFLYRCIQNHDGKLIDFNAVGALIGAKPTAARMRYSRLKAKFEPGIGFESSVATAGPRIKRKLIPAKKATNKRKKVKEEKDSAMSSFDDEDVMVAVKEEEGTLEQPSNRRTRRKIMDLKAAFESDTASSVSQYEDNSDDYEATENLTDKDEDISGIEEQPNRRQSKSKSKPPTAKVNATPITSKPKVPLTPQSLPTQSISKSSKNTTLRLFDPVTPGSPQQSLEIRKAIILTPPQSLFRQRKRSAASAISQLSPEEVRDDLTRFKIGAMVPLDHHQVARGRSAAQSPIPEDGVLLDVACISPSESASVIGNRKKPASFTCTSTSSIQPDED